MPLRVLRGSKVDESTSPEGIPTAANYDAIMRSATGVTLCTLTLALGVALSGCASNGAVSVTPPSGGASSVARTASTGGAVPDAKTLVHEARAAYRAAKSAHVHATISAEGDTQVIDIHGTMDGSNQVLTVDDSESGNATVRTVGGNYYVKGDKDFWASAAHSDGSAAALLAGKWVLAPDSATGDFKRLTIRRLLEEMLGPQAISDSDTEQMKTYATTEQDTELFAAVSVDPMSEDVSTLKVVASDPHNVVEVAGNSTSGSNGTADFDGWDAQAKVTVPKGYITFPGSGSTV